MTEAPVRTGATAGETASAGAKPGMEVGRPSGAEVASGPENEVGTETAVTEAGVAITSTGTEAVRAIAAARTSAGASGGLPTVASGPSVRSAPVRAPGILCRVPRAIRRCRLARFQALSLA